MMVTKRPLSYWVKTTSFKLQLILLVVIVITVGARVLPLEMQKKIVNQAIRLQKVDLLLIYCAYYIGAVILAGALKYLISVLQTYIGQQALARIRKELYAHILTLPINFFRKTSSGMVVSTLVTEVANIGEFVGQAMAVSVTNALTLVAFATYMFFLSPILAALSLATFPIFILIIPRLQAKSNRANKQRVDATREISGKVGEAISAIHEIHGNGSYNIENRKYGEMVEKLFRIRVIWMLYKQGIKCLNNFIQNLGPFVLFLVGGYLAINGRFDLGALVAFLSAYEKLYDPCKELMEFYQTYQDSSVSYKRIMEYFDVEPEHTIEPEGREPYAITGAITARNATFTVSGGIQLLKSVNLDLKPGEHLALVGFSGSGKSTLAACVGQLYKYTGGSILLDDKEVTDLTKKDVVYNLGIVAQSPYVFDGSIRENLIYSCEAVADGPGRELPNLDEMIQSLQQVGIFADVLRFGLNTVLAVEEEKELVEKLIRIRNNFQENFGEELAGHVEFFDEKRYLYYASVAANLLFGNALKKDFSLERLPDNAYFLEFLNEAQLRSPLLSLGRELAQTTVDILGNMPPEEVFFGQSPIPIDEFPDYKALVARMEGEHLRALSEEDQHRLLKLALRFTPGLHKIVSLPRMLEDLVLEGRGLFREKVDRELPGSITFYRMTEYITSQTVLDNILFGRPRTDNVKAQDKINQSIMQLLIEEDLLERIVDIGMDFRVGTKGDRLSGGQRQKLAIARVFLKKPPILIMDEATSALDNASQQRIQNLLETRWKGKSTLISVVHRLDTIKNYDKVAVMKAGKIIEIGGYDELLAKKGVLYELVYGSKSAA